MFYKVSTGLFVMIVILVSTACTSKPNTPTPAANMANPASVYCEQNGGKLDLRQDASGSAVGICIFTDRSECDEWAYFRGECKPGDTLPTIVPTVAPMTASDLWKVYRSDTLGFSFQYPADATVGSADDPAKTLTITGPMIGNDHWPVIFINYPSDREDYRPTEGADLAQWLTDHNLLVGERHSDVQIAGTTAIHTRFPRSQQSFAYDNYFFARSGQLYGIVILHTGDKEDWDLYNHFLASFQF
jgi:putative hemolysin